MRRKNVSLAAKITMTLIALLALAVISSSVAISSAYRFQSFQDTLVVENLASVEAAEELEIALLEQRGYVASYLLARGDPKWLKDLPEKSRMFDVWLARRDAARTDPERQLLDELERVQHAYAEKRDEVVARYRIGEEEEVRRLLLGNVTELYEDSFDLCEEFITLNRRQVEDTGRLVAQQVDRVTVIVSITALVTLALGMALLWFFFQGVIFPLRRIAADARRFAGTAPIASGGVGSDEMRELGQFVKLLMTNVAETRSDLEQSRSQLAQADKLAAVGKLAASVAHEIRNPLTSMKMWLYSLRRAVGENPELREKVDIVSEETVRLENIVRQFLEFSRPPQMKMSRQPISELLDSTLELLKYRLEEHNIRIIRQDDPALPEVLADAEQLKQVLMNLIHNAMEAMSEGGELRITARQETRAGKPVLAVRITDKGPGMSLELQERAFEPFFTTKAEGTGLGLCIAASIMARHGGALTLESLDTGGTECSVWIPTIEARHDE